MVAPFCRHQDALRSFWCRGRVTIRRCGLGQFFLNSTLGYGFRRQRGTRPKEAEEAEEARKLCRFAAGRWEEPGKEAR